MHSSHAWETLYSIWTLCAFSRHSRTVASSTCTNLLGRTFFKMASTSGLPPLDPLFKSNAKRTYSVFASYPDAGLREEEKRCAHGIGLPYSNQRCSNSARLRLSVKINDEYKDYKQLPSALLAQQGPVGPARPTEIRKAITAGPSSETTRLIASIDTTPEQRVSTFSNPSKFSQALMLHKTTRTVKPTYHAPWKLVRVISGHLGWVRSVAVEPGNKWFATGAGDRVIKIWNLASGELRLSLTGHISTVRGLAVSPRHPYLFSCGEDKVRLCHVLYAASTLTSRGFLDGQMLGSRS